MSMNPTTQRRGATPTRRRPPPRLPVWSPAICAAGRAARSPADGPFGAGVPTRGAGASRGRPATTGVTVGDKRRVGRAEGGDAP